MLGPFWISTTLIFAVAMSGNIASWNEAAPELRDAWHYDFGKCRLSELQIAHFHCTAVTAGASAIYTYIGLVRPRAHPTRAY